MTELELLELIDRLVERRRRLLDRLATNAEGEILAAGHEFEPGFLKLAAHIQGAIDAVKAELIEFQEVRYGRQSK